MYTSRGDTRLSARRDIALRLVAEKFRADKRRTNASTLDKSREFLKKKEKKERSGLLSCRFK